MSSNLDEKENGSSHSSTTSYTVEEGARPASGLADREDRAVARSKVVVHLFLLVAAAICGYVTYKISSAQETDAFESGFTTIANEVILTAQANGDKVASVLGEFAIQVTTHALATNATWPYVTLPFYESRAEAARSVAKLNSINTVMLGVNNDNKQAWLDYSVQEQDWIDEDRKAQGSDLPPEPPINDYITFYNTEDDLNLHPYEGNGPYEIMWQRNPYNVSGVNTNIYNIASPYINFVQETKRPALSMILGLEQISEGEQLHPTALYYQPIFDSLGPMEERNVPGVLAPVLQWNIFFDGIISQDEGSVYCVIKSACANQTMTYLIEGPKAKYLGFGDHHDPDYEDMAISSSFFDAENSTSEAGLSCGYSLSISPTQKMDNDSRSSVPVIFSAVVVLVFIFTAIVFTFYDFLVQRRQATIMDSAVRTNAIVDSLFPAQFRDQLLRDQGSANGTVVSANKNRGMLSDFLAGKSTGTSAGSGDLTKSKPFADFFPHATVMFSDIQGFTSWSSMREPAQVFTLLEGIYSAFDKIAKRRGVFKVETVGDAYVAVLGVPTPEKNHAALMCRYAAECAKVLPEILMSLERVLGPGTGDLHMRFGLHSGPVTAGVLRGDKARFQLFGDTVNTAARIESSGRGGMIHLTEQTAEELKAASKEHWLVPREDMVHLKGKGVLKTYWLDINGNGLPGRDGTCPVESSPEYKSARNILGESLASDSINRLIDWNVEMLMDMLRQIVSAREGTKRKKSFNTDTFCSDSEQIPLEEVVDIITLPSFDKAKAARQREGEKDVEEKVREQLSSFVVMVAQSYGRNPFHNFEHASHVAMSVRKLLSRVVAPDVTAESSKMAMALHDHTYGITSDPLTQFAIVVAALIHDVDHPGVSNGQLAKENPALSAKYHEKSIAEQNSVDIAWAFLMSDGLEDLRKCIFADADEYKRFRQIVVQCVMATDIFDKQLSELRKKRWESAFDQTKPDKDETRSTNRKATIVIEHILQASDVAHTMQHWHVYTKWNERLFQEMFSAYKEGRSDKNPADSWYKGEIWFFDMYVIPLAKKLDSCGVFGVSSDECLSYALENRKEWEIKGQEIVKSMAERTTRMFGDVVPDNEDASLFFQ